MSGLVAIVGRPNVGKSTLFNRLTGARKAIVDDVSGVTRDRHYGISDWNGIQFNLVDTGGYVVASDDVFESAIREQVELAMAEADAIIFMVDVATGITDLDSDMAHILRRSAKPVLVVVNKVDNHKREMLTSEFYSLGLGDFFSVSSVSGSGTGDMLDELVKHLPTDDLEESDMPRVAILGRPNSGKSTLLNAFLGEERSIVTPIAGTTRDSLHATYNKFGKKIQLIDTAGIRKRAKVHENIEFYSVMRAIRALEEADVCVIMLDASLGMQAQDVNIFQLAEKRGKGIVVLINKWDLKDKERNIDKTVIEQIHQKIAPFTDIPILFISALEKLRIFKAMEAIEQVYENKQRTISTSKLNEFLLPIIQKTPPPASRGKYVKIKYITQLKTRVPSFAFFCNHPKDVKENYKRFLENKLRDTFDYTGVPMKIYFRQK